MADILGFPGTDLDNVTQLPVKEVFNVDIPIDKVIEGVEAIKENLDCLILIGSAADGTFYFASSSGDNRQVLYDIESAKMILMSSSISIGE